MTVEKQKVVRERCLNFAVSLCKQLRNRLPDNFEILKKMSLFSVSECLKVVKEPVSDIAEILGYSPDEIDRILNQ